MTRPSLSDFGTHDESAYPELWRGVVGAWCPSLGPTGDRLHDFSRRNNWGTLTNMDPATDWVVDRGQYALDFDGSNDHAPCGTSNDLLGGQLSISAWILFRPGLGLGSIISNILSNGAAGSVHFEVNRILNKLSFLNNGSGTGIHATSTASVTYTRFDHVVAVRSGSTGAWIITLSVNNASNSTSTSFNPDTSRGNLTIGRAGDYLPSLYLNAIVSELTLWNRPLSLNEIDQLYNLGRGGMYTRRTRRSFYIPAGFNASWARNSNVILGAGATC